MSNQNPFNFINPLLLKFPANKIMICPVEEVEHYETYFNGVHEKRKQRWTYDNYFFRDIPFDIKQRRGDRVNIEERMRAIHLDELKKPVPSCTQSMYGHRVAKYDQKTGEVYARKYEIQELYRGSGMAWPKQEREQAFNKDALDAIKPDRLD